MRPAIKSFHIVLTGLSEEFLTYPVILDYKAAVR